MAINVWFACVHMWSHQDGGEEPWGGWRRQQTWHSETRWPRFCWRMTFQTQDTCGASAAVLYQQQLLLLPLAQAKEHRTSAPRNRLFTANPPPHPLGTRSWPKGCPSRPLTATASFLGWHSTVIFTAMSPSGHSTVQGRWAWAWPAHPSTDCTASETGPQLAAGYLPYTLERARRCKEIVCACFICIIAVPG